MYSENMLEMNGIDDLQKFTELSGLFFNHKIMDFKKRSTRGAVGPPRISCRSHRLQDWDSGWAETFQYFGLKQQCASCGVGVWWCWDEHSGAASLSLSSRTQRRLSNRTFVLAPGLAPGWHIPGVAAGALVGSSAAQAHDPTLVGK